MKQRPIKLHICNERFLSRFGVDRLLLLAGRHFAGHEIEVSYHCLRYNQQIFERGQKIIAISLPPGLDMRGTEQAATGAMLNSWLVEKPDVVLVGGWPFFKTAAVAPSVGVHSVFIDAGAIPHDGLADNTLWPQLELCRLRQTFLPWITSVLPISDFIRDSQSLPDRGRAEGVRTVLLGSDHFFGTFAPPAPREPPVQALASLVGQGAKLVLNLGRFEPAGYKNSPEFFDVIRMISQKGTSVVGLILAEQSEVQIPLDMQKNIFCLGHPSDDELLSVMQAVDAGISLSLWEGFNLPIVEMQQIGKPALAFSIGAHPEVIAHPWLLCCDKREMAGKLEELLEPQSEAHEIIRPSLEAFHERMPWSRTLGEWLAEIRRLCVSETLQDPAAGRRLLIIDVTNSAADSANSGVVRVTRQLTARLKHDRRFDVLFVSWDSKLKSYVLVNDDALLRGYGGPGAGLGKLTGGVPRFIELDLLLFARDPGSADPPILFTPEIALDGSADERMRWARYRGLLVSAILYDLIPVYSKEYCSPDVVANFAGYLSVVERSDQCIAISQTSLADLVRHARDAGGTLPAQRAVVWLPSQYGNSARARDYDEPPKGEVRILCISTIEPRKNHGRLIDAYRQLVQRRPDLDYRLILIGNSYAGRDDLLEPIKKAESEEIGIEWLGVLSDQALEEEYKKARFTIYPTLVEGFGLPIVESLWLGRPCICANEGVMAELAEGGGCLTVDVRNTAALSAAMEALATDDGLLDALAIEATARPLTTWNDYALSVGDALAELGAPRAHSATGLSHGLALETMQLVLDGS